MPSDRWPGGGTREWRKIRAEVIDRDGGQCTHVDADTGVRCPKKTTLEVHHTKPGAAIDASKEDLVTFCKAHHPPADQAWKDATAEEMAKAAIARLDVKELDIRDLMPALWNANHTHRATMEKIKNSVREFGVVENLVVRDHPEFPGKYEVLSGNHRLQIFKQLRIKKVSCHVIKVDDAMARVLAQTLNRTRGSDDPQKLAELMDHIHQALPKKTVEEYIEGIATVPLPGAMEKLLAHQRTHTGPGYEFHPINAFKLGHRLEACCHPRKMEKALELFAGHGQLTYWYKRLFEEVVRVDQDAEGEPDFHMSANEYLTTRFIQDGPFDFVDLDDEGSPHAELDTLFEVLAQNPHPPFILCATDGLVHRLKLIRKKTTDLMLVYRWPETAAADKRIYLRCPELLDHGVHARAEQAGYTAETIALDWKPGKSATFGTWLIGPDEDTRTQLEQDTEPAGDPEAWGAWRISPKKPRVKQPPVEERRQRRQVGKKPGTTGGRPGTTGATGPKP